MYKCVVKNAAGSVESRIFTLNRADGQISQLTLSIGSLIENGKACAVSVYAAEAGIQEANGELFVSDNPAATDAATDYMTFIGTVTKKSAGDAIPDGKDCYFSLFPLSGECGGLTLRGAKYTLEEAVINIGSSLCTSNEFTEGPAELFLRYGTLLVVLTLKETALTSKGV